SGSLRDRHKHDIHQSDRGAQQCDKTDSEPTDPEVSGYFFQALRHRLTFGQFKRIFLGYAVLADLSHDPDSLPHLIVDPGRIRGYTSDSIVIIPSPIEARCIYYMYPNLSICSLTRPYATLFVQYSCDCVGFAQKSNLLIDWVFSRIEQDLFDLFSDDGHGSPIPNLHVTKVSTFGQFHCLDRKVVFVTTSDPGIWICFLGSALDFRYPCDRVEDGRDADRGIIFFEFPSLSKRDGGIGLLCLPLLHNPASIEPLVSHIKRIGAKTCKALCNLSFDSVNRKIGRAHV